MRGFKFLLGLIAFCLFALALPTNSTAHPWDGGPGVTLIADQQSKTHDQFSVWTVSETPIQNQTILQNYVSSPGLMLTSNYILNTTTTTFPTLTSSLIWYRGSYEGSMNTLIHSEPLISQESVGIIKGPFIWLLGRNMTNT